MSEIRSTRILFASPGAGSRAVVAAALARLLTDLPVHVEAAAPRAGKPLGREYIDAAVARGIDIAEDLAVPYQWDVRFDVVVTIGFISSMSCGEDCPIYFDAQYHYWPIEHASRTGDATATVKAIEKQVNNLMRIAGLVNAKEDLRADEPVALY